MEFVDGVKLTDVESIRGLGFTPHSVAKLVAECFNEMIFKFGDVHCDPHVANLMVRKDKHGQMQLVLLDHGLYRCVTSLTLQQCTVLLTFYQTKRVVISTSVFITPKIEFLLELT